MNQDLGISSTSLFLCEMSSKCFKIIILFLLRIILEFKLHFLNLAICLTRGAWEIQEKLIISIIKRVFGGGSIPNLTRYFILVSTRLTLHLCISKFQILWIFFPFSFLYFFSKRLRNNRHQFNFLVVLAKTFPYHH